MQCILYPTLNCIANLYVFHVAASQFNIGIHQDKSTFFPSRIKWMTNQTILGGESVWNDSDKCFAILSRTDRESEFSPTLASICTAGNAMPSPPLLEPEIVEMLVFLSFSRLLCLDDSIVYHKFLIVKYSREEAMSHKSNTNSYVAHSDGSGSQVFLITMPLFLRF